MHARQAQKQGLSEWRGEMIGDGVSGIRAKRENMEEKLQRSLMLVTCLSPRIGYENAAKCAHKALEEGTSLKEAVTALGFLDASEYEEAVRPERML